MDASRNIEEGVPIPLPPDYSNFAFSNLPKLISPPTNPHYSAGKEKIIKPMIRNGMNGRLNSHLLV